MTLAVPGDGAFVEHTVAPVAPAAVTRLPGLTVAAMTSIGAGVIHAAAAGVHAEHPQLARLFILCSIAQVGVGLVAMSRTTRLAAFFVVAVNAVAVGGWLATRLTGISWIVGLEVREAPQFADTACALLGAAAVGCALGAWMLGKREGPAPRLLFPAIAVAALTVPAMLSAGTHVHSHAHVASASGAVVDESQPHTHTGNAAAPAAAIDESQSHTHTTDPASTAATANWPAKFNADHFALRRRNELIQFEEYDGIMPPSGPHLAGLKVRCLSDQGLMVYG